MSFIDGSPLRRRRNVLFPPGTSAPASLITRFNDTFTTGANQTLPAHAPDLAPLGFAYDALSDAILQVNAAADALLNTDVVSSANGFSTDGDGINWSPVVVSGGQWELSAGMTLVTLIVGAQASVRVEVNDLAGGNLLAVQASLNSALITVTAFDGASLEQIFAPLVEGTFTVRVNVSPATITLYIDGVPSGTSPNPFTTFTGVRKVDYLFGTETAIGYSVATLNDALLQTST